MWCILPLLCFIIVTNQIYASDEVESAIEAKKQYYDLEKIEDLFNEFIVTYQKEYDEEEYAKRLQIFKKNVEAINELNKNSTTAVYGISKFADVSSEEIINYTGGEASITHLRGYNSFCAFDLYYPQGPKPRNLDYRTLGYVTPVRNQKQCGSCYAHSSIGNLEGQYFKKYGKLISFSDQQIVDCGQLIGSNSGCGGGSDDNVMKYLYQVGGIQRYKDYPFNGTKGLYCRFKQRKVVAKVTGCLSLGFTDEEDMTYALHEYGPLIIGISSSSVIKDYTHGVISNYIPREENPRLSHSVLLVGYGTENGVPFWIIKNSWGPDWGDSGYFRVLRGNKLFSISDYVATGFVA